MTKFPYGISNFNLLRKKNYLYIDRTNCIPMLEESGLQLLFLRPRRIGKSLLLSMLENYYDINRVDEFDTLFGDLVIGKNPTSERNQYLILKWDFSNVSAKGNADKIETNLFSYINVTIKDFLERYKPQLKFPIKIVSNNAIASFQSLIYSVKNSGYSVYLFIDEYDNFANEVLMQRTTNIDRYRELIEAEGIIKTIFKTIKSAATNGGLDRVFITGVSPLVMSDMTSGYNVAKNISLREKYNALCGLTEKEVIQITEQVIQDCHLSEHSSQETIEMMRIFYNGYRFCYDVNEPLIYNPTLVFYFLDYFQKDCCHPSEMLDDNLAMDKGKIAYIASLPNGQAIIQQAIDETNPLTTFVLSKDFGIDATLNPYKNTEFMVSLLYYFGVLTIQGRNLFGMLEFGIPNLVIHKLYVETLQQAFMPKRDYQVIVNFYTSVKPQPLMDYIEENYLTVFDNRDYRWSNELTIKTLFLTLLFNDTIYIMDSETAIKRRYTDLTMIVRDNMRQNSSIQDIVFEFKFIKLKDLALTAEGIRKMSCESLKKLPKVTQQLKDATIQLTQYQIVLNKKYQQPKRLQCLAVVALGFERLVWKIV